MQYYLLSSKEKIKVIKIFPCIVLRRDIWDDYGFKTTIHLEYYSAKKSIPIDLGTTKILRQGQTSGYTELPTKFESLSKEFCSLGQSETFYETIREKNIIHILSDLRDIAYKDIYVVNFKEETGYRDSLLRFGKADKMIMEAREILAVSSIHPSTRNKDYSFDYSLLTPSSRQKINLRFNFENDDILPFRTNVIVGKNGTGKSLILSQLAISQSGIGKNNTYESLISSGGNFKFSDIIVLSYNPFDSFKDIQELNDGKISNSSIKRNFLPYTFFGIRKIKKNENGEPSIILKSHKTIRIELNRNFKRILKLNRLSFLEEIINETFLREIDFKSTNTLVKRYDKLSSGQKIILKIIIDLVSHAHRDNLILFDEPESYLHPQGISSFQHAINRILCEYDAYSIIATHSPIIVQETPSKYVTILKKRGGNIIAFSPKTETLGQSLNSIINEAFGLSVEDKNFYLIYDKFRDENFTIRQLEEKLGKKLSLNARSYFLNIQN